jgi:DNA end-binding protein Ku
MAESGKIALARLVMHNRERIVALEPGGRGLLMTTLRAADEVRNAKEFFDDIPAAKTDKQMLEIAAKIIAQQSGAFKPTDFVDRYEHALKDLIKQKQKGKTLVAEEPPEDTKVIDLMDALKKSLASEGKRGTHAKRVLSKQTGTKPSAAASSRTKSKKRAGGRP